MAPRIRVKTLNYSVGLNRWACTETTRIKLTRPSPRLVYHCNDAISRIQEGPRTRCTQARSLERFWNACENGL